MDYSSYDCSSTVASEILPFLKREDFLIANLKGHSHSLKLFFRHPGNR